MDYLVLHFFVSDQKPYSNLVGVFDTLKDAENYLIDLRLAISSEQVYSHSYRELWLSPQERYCIQEIAHVTNDKPVASFT